MGRVYSLLEVGENGEGGGGKLGRISTGIRALENVSRRCVKESSRQRQAKEGLKLTSGRGRVRCRWRACRLPGESKHRQHRVSFFFSFPFCLPSYMLHFFFLLCFSGLRIKPWTAVSWHWFAWFVCIVMRDALSSGSPYHRSHAYWFCGSPVISSNICPVEASRSTTHFHRRRQRQCRRMLLILYDGVA